jgi:hypothetical protein
MPGFREDSELVDKVRLDGPAALDALKKVLSDAASSSERKYAAMGLLVALHNQELLATSVVLPILEDVVSQSSKGAYDQTRCDALGALASLYSRSPRAPEGLGRVIAIARDPASHENLRRDALQVLAERQHPLSAETLAWGLLELQESHGRFALATALGEMPQESWNAKAMLFVNLLRDGSKQRGQIDSGAIIHALRSQDEPWTRRLGPLTDFLIHSAIDADERMAGNLAELLVECVGGNPDLAGYAINLYERNHNLPETALKELRIQVGGAPALSGIVKVLKDDLDQYFQKPILALNEYTVRMWQDTLMDARRGFQARTWMSVAVFCLGVLLVLTASYGIVFPAAQTSSTTGNYAAVLAGLVIMLLVIYTGPLKEIRQSVTDLATASAAFIAYVHRVLETSHTFSYYYLKEKISFDEMKKSSALMTEAMNNTIEALGRKAVDSSQETLERAAELILKHRAPTERQESTGP